MIKKKLTFSVPITQKDSVVVEGQPVDNQPLRISGYANTTKQDRSGDVIVTDAWLNGGIANYMKNPIILAYHDHTQPIGTAEEVSVDSNGLKISAKISPAAEDVYTLIKEGVLKAFSVGFYIKDAEYDSATDIFIIKDVELLEISVVSVPCNQDSLFEMSKDFKSDGEILEFKKSFTKAVEPTSTKQAIKGEILMDPKDLEQLLAQAAASGAKAAQEAIEKANKEAAEKAAAEKAAAEKAEADRKAIIELGASGAERLVKEVEDRLKSENADVKKIVEDFRNEINENLKTVATAAASKHTFDDKSDKAGEPTLLEKTNAVVMAKAMGKDVLQTKYGQSLVQKYGQHVPSAYWEDTVSLTMEEEIRRALVVAPLIPKMIMPSSILRMPLNPEAGYGSWVNVTSYGTTSSSGTAGTHVLKEITLSAYKLATKEFLQYEEEDDALVALLPIITDAMKRRMAKSIDSALLIGAGSGANPLKGLTVWATAGDQVSVTKSSKATVANLQSMRRKLGTWGLTPNEVIYVVSSDVYYDLLDDADFRTWDKVGDKATIINGAVGQVLGSNVIVSGEFSAKPTGTNTGVGAVAFNARNFVFGQYKDLRMETEIRPEYQYKIIISTMRLAFQQLTTNEGNAAGTLLWT